MKWKRAQQRMRKIVICFGRNSYYSYICNIQYSFWFRGCRFVAFCWILLYVSLTGTSGHVSFSLFFVWVSFECVLFGFVFRLTILNVWVVSCKPVAAKLFQMHKMTDFIQTLRKVFFFFFFCFFVLRPIL